MHNKLEICNTREDHLAEKGCEHGIHKATLAFSFMFHYIGLGVVNGVRGHTGAEP